MSTALNRRSFVKIISNLFKFIFSRTRSLELSLNVFAEFSEKIRRLQQIPHRILILFPLLKRSVKYLWRRFLFLFFQRDYMVDSLKIGGNLLSVSCLLLKSWFKVDKPSMANDIFYCFCFSPGVSTNNFFSSKNNVNIPKQLNWLNRRKFFTQYVDTIKRKDKVESGLRLYFRALDLYQPSNYMLLILMLSLKIPLTQIPIIPDFTQP